MDATHLHLLFNHVGILGLLFSACILLVAILLKSGILKRTAMTGFVIAAVAAAVTMNTGEGAEETVEHISGVAEAAIHEHEEAAESTIWLVGVCGLLSLIGLIFYFLSRTMPAAFYGLLLLVSLVASAMIFNTGRLGGLIRHTELSGTAPAPDSGHTAPAGEEEHAD
jgi:uncharacterized membrane protein